MGRRARRRGREGLVAGKPAAPSATSDYADAQGNVLTLRDQLSAGTLRELERLDSRPAATAEDRWQRRVELLFEHLAVGWEIAGVPLAGQRELLGRYRMATAEERGDVRQALAEHLRTGYPELNV